jgi:hypothetical protein
MVDYKMKTVSFTLQHSHEDNTIVRFQNCFDPRNNTLLIMPDNLKDQQSLSFSIGTPTKFQDWWTGRVFAAGQQKLTAFKICIRQFFAQLVPPPVRGSKACSVAGFYG